MLHMMRSMYDLLREGVFFNRQVMFKQRTSRAALLDQHRAINTALQAVADQIIGAFRQAAPSDSAAWSDFQSGIGAAGTDQNNAYGEYRVLFNDFIQFDAAGNEIADVYGTAPEDTLKVVIAGPNDDPLTFLLVR